MGFRILILLCFFFSSWVLGQNQLSKFKHFTLEDGLSQSTVACILKDSRGFMWFGTEDGLNKYDGSNFTVYRHIPNDIESLSSSYINDIVEQGDGFLWIATKNGLNYFDPNTEKFTRYLHQSTDPKSISNNQINTLQMDRDGQLLIGTLDGLNMYNPKTGFIRYKSENTEHTYDVKAVIPNSMGDLWVLSSGMLERVQLKDKVISPVGDHIPMEGSVKYSALLDGSHLWIGTNKGLISFHLKSKATKTFAFYDKKLTNDPRNGVLSLRKGPEGTLWVGTSGSGLIKFDKQKGTFQSITHNPYNKFSVNSNAIRSLFFDESDILWLGTYGGGVNKYDANQFRFEHYRNYPGDINSLSENGVRSLLLDSDGDLWIGTHGGLNRMNRKTGEIKVYTHVKNKMNSISSNVVRSLAEDTKGIIWAGTWSNGVNSFDKNTGLFKRYTYLPGRKKALGQVRSLTIDETNNIWIGANGLWLFDPIKQSSEGYFHQENNANSLSSNGINTLFFDRNGVLWIGTQKGLNAMNISTKHIQQYIHHPNDPLSLNHEYITSIAEDANGQLWIGTYGGGLNVLDKKKGTFKHFTTANGLLNDVVYGVLVDNQGLVWFTSNTGLGRFNPTTEVFNYFGIEDGIQSAEFNAGAYAKSAKGEFFFGGINGFNAFFPEAINYHKKTGSLVLTNFELLDEEESQIQALLDTHISRVKEITLKHDQNTFSLRFSELNYADNVDNGYEYRVLGLDKNWVNLHAKQDITVGNLKPGTYSLQVRIQDDPTKNIAVSMIVLPPLWQTTWAYILYALLFGIIVWVIIRNVRKIKRTRRQFELRLQDWENSLSNAHKVNSLHGHGAILSLKEVEITSADQKFLEKAVEIVEAHIEDSGFGVEKLRKEMSLSRSQLHRKLKTLTGYSTTKFIRLIRLKRAAQLLIGKTGTVSEIAYKVGFDNMGYFSKCFRETFGKPPSQYQGQS